MRRELWKERTPVVHPNLPGCSGIFNDVSYYLTCPRAEAKIKIHAWSERLRGAEILYNLQEM